MKKQLLTFVITLLITTLASAQKTKKFEFHTGPSLFAPITKTIDWDNKAWGQRVNVEYKKNKDFSYVLTFGYQQSKENDLQAPVILNVQHRLFKNIHIFGGMGTTFSNMEMGKFTLSTGVSYVQKRWTIQQSIFRVTKMKNNIDGEHFNNIGVALLYKL